MVPPMGYHGITTASHGVAKDSMEPWGGAWHAIISSAMATATVALHGNLTPCQANPHGTPLPTAPRIG